MPNIEKEKIDDFYSSCFDWYGTDSKLYPEYAKLGLSLEIIKTFCDGYINWLENENNPKELGKFQGDTTDIERVGLIISMEYDLANEKIKKRITCFLSGNKFFNRKKNRHKYDCM